MPKTKLAKLTATAITGTALTLGALVTFQGTETIDLAKTTIIELGEKIGIYESNETKLINRINELKVERDGLISDLSKYEGMDADEINEQIENLENQIAEYEVQLSNAEKNAETLAGRILDLEAEVLKANNKTSELQTILDENVIEDEPLTHLEVEEITGKIIERTRNEAIWFKGGDFTEGVKLEYDNPKYMLRNTTKERISYKVENVDTEMKILEPSSSQWIKELNTTVGSNKLIVVLNDGTTYRMSVINKK